MEQWFADSGFCPINIYEGTLTVAILATVYPPIDWPILHTLTGSQYGVLNLVGVSAAVDLYRVLLCTYYSCVPVHSCSRVYSSVVLKMNASKFTRGVPVKNTLGTGPRRAFLGCT